MAESFVFYKSFYDAMSDVAPATRNKVYGVLIEYAITGIVPSLSGNISAFFKLMRPLIDANNRRRENGRLGGKPSGDKSEPDSNRDITEPEPDGSRDITEPEPDSSRDITESEPNVNVNVNANADVNANKNDNDPGAGADAPSVKAVAAHSHKRKYGEHNNVLLTECEYEKLKAQYPTDWAERVDRLSEYMAYKGAVYKSHYLTIINWAKRDAGKKAREDPDYSDPARYADMDLHGFRRASDDEFDRI